MKVNSFTLTINNFDNAAMVDAQSGEVSRMLRELADRIDGYGVPNQDGSRLVDSNGNQVGEVAVDWDEDPDYGDYGLYDSDTAEALSYDDLGITLEEYEAAIRESLFCAQVEGHIRIGSRRVYAAE